MNIGKPLRIIVVEPVTSPVPPRQEPQPAAQPAPTEPARPAVVPA